MKHVDFIILDILCLQVALMLAHACSGYGWDIYTPILYRNVAMFLGLADLMLLICRETMKGVIRRGHFREFTMTVKQAEYIQDDEINVFHPAARISFVHTSSPLSIFALFSG